MNKKIIIGLVLVLMLVPVVSAAHATYFTIPGQILDGSGNPQVGVNVSATISTASSCSSSLIFNGSATALTDSLGAYYIPVSADMNYNQNYYICLYEDGNQTVGPTGFRGGQGEIDENDVNFYDLTIGNDLTVDGFSYFDGSLIPTTNATWDFGSLTDMWHDAYFSGDLYVEGGILGNLSYTNLFPIFDNMYSVGNQTHRWQEGYFLSMGIGNISGSPDDTLEVGGSIILTEGDQWIYGTSAGSYGYDLTIAGGAGGCFPEDTMITTPTGYKDISKIEVGDMLVSYDTETNTKTESKVIEIDSLLAHSYYVLNDDIRVTSEHPFYTPTGWKEAKTLKVGDYLFDGSNWIYLSSTKIKYDKIEVFNMHVTEPNNFFADGVLVHNKDMSPRVGGNLWLSGGDGAYGADNGNVTIGYDNYGTVSTVNISGAYVLPTYDGTDGQVLATDGYGWLDWVDASGASYWNRTGTEVFLGTLGDNVLIDGTNGSWLGFEPNNNAWIGYNSGILYFESGNTNDQMHIFADDGIQLNAGTGDVDIISGNLTIGAYTLPNTDGTINQTLVTDGAGNVAWQDQTGSGGTSYWNRTGTVLETATAGDSVALAPDSTLNFNLGAIFNGIRYNSTSGFLQFDGGKLHSNNMDLLFEDGYGIEFEPTGDMLWYDSGNSRFDLTDDLYVNGDMNISGVYYGNGSGLTDLPVGTTYWNRTGTTLITATSGDTVVIGDTSDNVTITGTTITLYGDVDILPNANGTANNLGTSTQWFDDAYLRDIFGLNGKFSNSLVIGNSVNYSSFDSDGHLTMYGSARVWKSLNDFYPYNIGGIAGTYNGITNGVSGLGSLNGMYFKTYDDGGVGTAEASNIAVVLPQDYIDGTDIEVNIAWTVAGTTGVVRWQAGGVAISDTDTYSPATYVWATPQDITVAGTAWERDTAVFTLNGASYVKGDSLSIVVFRDADNGADTYTGDSYTGVVRVRYMSDKIGVKV